MSPSFFKDQTDSERILNAIGHSLASSLAAFRGEAASCQLVLLNAALVLVAFLFDVSRGKRALMVTVRLLALVVELFNLAIETTTDRISLERYPSSKNAKGMDSAV